MHATSSITGRLDTPSRQPSLRMHCEQSSGKKLSRHNLPQKLTCGSEKKNDSLKSEASTLPVTNQPLRRRPSSTAAAISFAVIPRRFASSPALKTCRVNITGSSLVPGAGVRRCETYKSTAHETGVQPVCVARCTARQIGREVGVRTDPDVLTWLDWE